MGYNIYWFITAYNNFTEVLVHLFSYIFLATNIRGDFKPKVHQGSMQNGQTVCTRSEENEQILILKIGPIWLVGNNCSMILICNFCCVLMLFFWMFPVQRGYCTCEDIVKDLFFLVQLKKATAQKWKIYSRKIHHERTCVYTLCLRKPGNPPAATVV